MQYCAHLVAVSMRTTHEAMTQVKVGTIWTIRELWIKMPQRSKT